MLKLKIITLKMVLTTSYTVVFPNSTCTRLDIYKENPMNEAKWT